MKIKVNEDNLTKLGKALDKANGAATKHVAVPANILALASKAEDSLDSSGLPITRRVGVQAIWHAAGASTLAYRYKMTRTRITLTRGTKYWFLTKVDRVGVHPQQREHYRIIISSAQRDRVVAEALRSFDVRIEAAEAPPANAG